MKTDKNDLNVAIDYRTYFFFKILYNETGSKEVNMTRGILVSLTLTVMVVLCFASVCVYKSSLDTFDSLKGVLLESMVLFVAVNELLNRNRVQRLMRYMNKSRKTLRYNLPEEFAILEEANKNVRKDIRFYAGLFAVNFPSLMLIKPIMEAFNGNSWKQYPFSWTIVPDNDVLVGAALAFQTFGIGFSHCLGAVGMCNVSTLPTHISALFDIVILSIDRIEDRAKSKRKEKGLTYQQSMTESLNESIAHHAEILAEMRSIKPYLETPFLSLMLFISMIIACEAFPLIQGNATPPLFVKGVIFLVVDVSCTAIVCNKMEGMADRNTEIFQALYDSPWTDCGVSYRRTLLNGLTFSRHPLLIQGKWFAAMKATRATFYSTMVSAFNILNMIRKVQ